MTKLILRLFIQDAENVKDPDVRERYGIVSSAVGIFCNLLLTAVKLLLGFLSGSIAVSADAFNNLSDAASSVVTLIGFKMARKPADRDHPFGHGRMEYISGLVVAFFVLVVGFEFARTSLEKIFHPEPVVFKWVVLIGLLLSIAVKFWMNRFNTALGRKVGSPTLLAAAADSISDVFATSVTIISVAASLFTDLPIDGFMGLVVAGLILWNGYNVAKDTVSPLLGNPPDPALIRQIREMLLSYDGVIGVHDLIVHDYGPGRRFASVHAEFSSDSDIIRSHETIDTAEREMGKLLNLILVIHLDPIDTNCEKTNELRQLCTSLVEKIDSRFSIHDFRIVSGTHLTNLIFDICVPIDTALTNEQIAGQVEWEVKQINPEYFAVINIDRDFT
ncbi:MAG: cation diffusion facilitator family transporter [Oscillospiraceae bacterium]|nr:cation diffusion facilitator family transporter [Oscillospiraceae bacterium]